MLAAIVLSSAVAARSAEAPAVDADQQRARAEVFVEDIIAELDVTEAQAAEMRAIHAAGEDQRRALLEQMQAVRDSDDARRAKMRRIRALRDQMRQHRQATREQLAGVLSDEQLAEYDALIAARREAMRERMRQQRPD